MSQFVPMPCDLETERLRLRQLREDDSEMVRKLWLERRSGLSLLAIEEKSNPGLLGYCGLTGAGSDTEPEIALEKPCAPQRQRNVEDAPPGRL